jgi:SagB-type dehydrogenase family enzyme
VYYVREDLLCKKIIIKIKGSRRITMSLLLDRRTFCKALPATIVTMMVVPSLLPGCGPSKKPIQSRLSTQVGLELPRPRFDSDTSIEETLLIRRSIRHYTGEPLALQEVSQVLWAAQAITETEYGFRTAPSAGASYPLEAYIVVGDIENLAPGVYRYIPEDHQIIKTIDGDIRSELAIATFGQEWVKKGALNIIFTSIYERTTQIYGERGIRYVHMEVGHAAQNVYLQVVALGLGTVVIGAFFDDSVRKLLNLPENEQPLYIMPVGRIRENK